MLGHLDSACGALRDARLMEVTADRRHATEAQAEARRRDGVEAALRAEIASGQTQLKAEKERAAREANKQNHALRALQV